MNLTPISERTHSSSDEGRFASPAKAPELIWPRTHYKCKRPSPRKWALARRSCETRGAEAKPFASPGGDSGATALGSAARARRPPRGSAFDLADSAPDPRPTRGAKRSFEEFLQKSKGSDESFEPNAPDSRARNANCEALCGETENLGHKFKILILPPERKANAEATRAALEKLSKLTISKRAFRGRAERRAQVPLPRPQRNLDSGLFQNRLGRRDPLLFEKPRRAPAGQSALGDADGKDSGARAPSGAEAGENALKAAPINFGFGDGGRKKKGPRAKIKFQQREFQKSEFARVAKFNSIDLESLDSPESLVFPHRPNNAVFYDLRNKCKYVKLTRTAEQRPARIDMATVVPLAGFVQGQLRDAGALSLQTLADRIRAMQTLISPVLELQARLKQLRPPASPDLGRPAALEKKGAKPVPKIAPAPPEPEKALEPKEEKQGGLAACAEPSKGPGPAPESKAVARLNWQSPKGKRRRAKPRNGCGCSRSKCLRLHCACFKKGVFCSENCGCATCFNRESNRAFVAKVNRKTREINPHAFESRVMSVEVAGERVQLTKGCRCSKNFCLKNYCECRKLGLRCSSLCHCSDCGNAKLRLDRALAQTLPKRKSRKKKKIVLSALNGNELELA